MKSLATLLLGLVGTAGAESIPRLSSPMVAAAPGLSLTAFGDSVFVGSYQQLSLYGRGRDRIVRAGSSSSPLLASENPRVYFAGNVGREIVIADQQFLRLDRPPVADWALSAVLRAGSKVGQSWPTGGMYHATSAAGGDVRGILTCGPSMLYQFTADLAATPPLANWSIPDTLGPYSYRMICDVDSSSDRAVRLRSLQDTAWQAVSGSASRILYTDTNTRTFHARSIDWVVSGYQGLWLAWDGTRHTAYFSHRGGGVDSTTVDLPAESFAYGSVAHRDSMVAFGLDSLLVVAKWTPTSFRVVSRSVLNPNRGVRALALADSTLWASTSDSLFSFRAGWGPESMAGIERTFSSADHLSLSLQCREARLSWTGSTSATVYVVDAQGRQAGRIQLEPGVASSWTAPRSGIWFARTATETRMFLVR